MKATTHGTTHRQGAEISVPDSGWDSSCPSFITVGPIGGVITDLNVLLN